MIRFSSNFKVWRHKFLRTLLLLLFLGYFGSITFFTHTHTNNGTRIVHSHPFYSLKGINSSSFEHTEKALKVIQLLSEFYSTALFFTFSALIILSFVRKISANPTQKGYAAPGGYCTYSLRAPPFELF